MHLRAQITNISRGSLHDGPGIRTVIYFKGCNLRCSWCHNPETLTAKKQILYNQSKCIHCGKCVKICKEHHKIEKKDMIFLRKGCTACGKCVSLCPSLALELCGKDTTTKEVFEEIKKDICYYNITGGGVTFSGGECLLYPDFVAEVAKECKKNNISTAVESALFVPFKNVEKVIPFIDLFFADLKIPDPKKHKAFTGQDNKLIIENIMRLSEIHNNVILRIPVIPKVNDSIKDITGFAEIIKNFNKNICKAELLKYNNLAKSKYLILGKNYTEFSSFSQSDEKMAELCRLLSEKSGIECFFS